MEMKNNRTQNAQSEDVTFISGNKNKVMEMQTILGDNVMLNTIDIDLPEYQGEEAFIAQEKVKEARKHLKTALIVEDSCLSFDALNGLPGPYIKWFLKLGPEGLYKMLTAYPNKRAVASLTIAFSEGPEAPIRLFRGETRGVIIAPRGNHGFGWDPIFLPEGCERTYAEMSLEEKCAISHRRKAIVLFNNFLKQRRTSSN